MKLTILHKGMIIVFVPLMVQIVCIAALYSLQSELERELDREHRSRLIVEMASKTARDLYVELDAIRKKGKFNIGPATRALNAVFINVNNNLRTLSDLVKDNPEETETVKSISSEMKDITDQVFAAKRVVHEGDMDKAVEMFHDAMENGKLVSIKASTQLLSLVDREKSITENSPMVLKTVREQLKMALAVAFIANIVLAALFAMIFNRNIASRIRVVSDNILRLAAGRELHDKLGGNDEVSAMDKAFRDMANSLSEAREQEQAMVSNAREVICSLTSDLKFLSVNPAIQLLLGFSSDELIGARFISILDPTSIDQSLEYFANLRKGEAVKVLENKVVGKDGSLRDFVWSVQWSDSQQSFFCVAHDITETKDLEKMKQAFVAMVSHDLRSPLCSIQSYTELLERGVYGKLSNSGLDSLKDVNGSVTRLITLVGDLIDIERLESGNLQLNLANVPVKRIFESAMQSVSALAATDEIVLKADDRGLEVHVDESRMVQVLVNLLSNAIKFSPAKSVVKLESSETAESTTLAVIDNGRGIPPDQLSAVFERFKQVQASDSDDRKGSGLGLSICKAIIEQHGGRIGAESQIGKGSRFWMELPKS